MPTRRRATWREKKKEREKQGAHSARKVGNKKEEKKLSERSTTEGAALKKAVPLRYTPGAWRNERSYEIRT